MTPSARSFFNLEKNIAINRKADSTGVSLFRVTRSFILSLNLLTLFLIHEPTAHNPVTMTTLLDYD